MEKVTNRKAFDELELGHAAEEPKVTNGKEIDELELGQVQGGYSFGACNPAIR